jgi:hypothetical protein
MWIRGLMTLGLFGLVCLAVAAQDPKLPANVVPATFRAYLVTDGRFPPVKMDGSESPDPRNRQGKIHCLVCENGLAPVVAIFVRSHLDTLNPGGGLAKLLKGLNALIPKYRSDKLASFVMFLRLQGGTKVVVVKTKLADGTESETKIEQDLEYPDDENREAYVKKIQAFANALNTPNIPFGLAAEKSKALTAWDVKETDEITVVFYHRLRIVGQPWRFAKDADLTDAKIAEILKTVQSTLTRE